MVDRFVHKKFYFYITAMVVLLLLAANFSLNKDSENYDLNQSDMTGCVINTGSSPDGLYIKGSEKKKELRRIFLDDNIFVLASGGKFKEVDFKSSSLVFNGIKMNFDPVIIHETIHENEKITSCVKYKVTRVSKDEDSKDSWDSFFSTTYSNKPFQLPVVLAMFIDNASVPITIISENGEKQKEMLFSVTDPIRIKNIILAGLFVFFVSFFIIVCKTSLLIDSYGMYSLTRTQMTFWFLLVFISFLCIYLCTGDVENIPDSLLLLMGVSSLSGVIGSAIESGNKANAEKSCCDFLHDIVSDKYGNPQIYRFQAILWTVVLGYIFIDNAIDMISMPEFDEQLLSLMLISQGTYLSLKYKNS